APVKYPVLRSESHPADGGPVLRLVWLSMEQRQALDGFPRQDGLVPGSEWRVDEASHVAWLCLDAWANRKITGAGLESAIDTSNGMQFQASQNLEQASLRIELTKAALSEVREQESRADKAAVAADRKFANETLEQAQRDLWLRRRNAAL